jgi:tRNA A-37 threonylcarbamoyl transferase component Bud32
VEPVSGLGPTVLDASAPGDAGEERLAAGARAGDYEVVEFLGAGAMGDVYAGVNEVIGKKVAIKVIKRKLAASAEAATRFLREARAANQVDHPNVVDVFALGRLPDGRLYLVMDLLDGAPLSARLKGGKRLGGGEALALLAPIASALDAAHARGVVHRDLKPDNVFVTGTPGEPQVHVLDFGIAKLLSSGSGGDDRPETLTAQGSWLGTPAYMAPEQWSADGAGPASDRYALGVIAYQMLAGDVPFRAGSLPAMMEKHFRAPVPSLSTGAGALPPAVDEVLTRALAKDPEARFATAQEMIGALRDALGTARGDVASAASTASGARPRVSVPRGPAIAGGALAVAALGAGVWMIARDRASDRPADPSHPGASPAAGAGQAEITTTPAGARVRRGGRDLGATPLAIDVGAAEDATIELDAAGYASVIRQVRAGDHLAVSLAPVRGFEGTWAMADGTLRAFERRGDEVACYALDRADGPRRLLRMFAFAAGADGEILFTADEELVDERAPDEPSCHIQVRAEYAYLPAGDALALRKQRASYDLAGGRCVVHAIAWTDRASLRRIGGRADSVLEATGAAPIKDVDAISDGKLPIKPQPQIKQIQQAKVPKVPQPPQPVPKDDQATAPIAAPPQQQAPQQQAPQQGPQQPMPQQQELQQQEKAPPDKGLPPTIPNENGKPIPQAQQGQQLAPQTRN